MYKRQSAAYPLFKDDLGLNFAQIGLITLVYQLSASVFQPITGIIFDKHPVAWSLPIGMSFTMIGMINLAFSNNLYWMLISVLDVYKRQVFGKELPNHQLHTVAARCGYDLTNHHHALADAEACAQIALLIIPEPKKPKVDLHTGSLF